MYNTKSLILGPCKRCYSLINLSKHGQVGLTAQPLLTVQNITQIYHSQNRCHSIKHAPSTGLEPKTNSSSESHNLDKSKKTETNDKIEREKDSSGISNHKVKLTNGVDNHEWEKPEGLDTGISVYNSITKKKEPLILPNGRIVTWYQCGPTVYGNAHIGHASAYLRTDIIRRVLMGLFNIDVVQVMGVTDIDDKIIKKAKELRYNNFLKLTQQYEASFFRDLDALKILRPTVKTRVTEFIPHIIKFIQQILDNGYAYRTTSGSVYFDVESYGKYGRLWTHSMDTEIREKANKEKKSARDFALWKAFKPDEPYWDSPFGKGRPGWHIECSTMASAVFGQTLDIHSGGDDLRFPHHENEMAQSEACFCGHQWTNYWIHTGSLHLRDDSDKMSKSLQNTKSIHELLSQYTPNQFRLFCMLRPYRNTIEYSDESMLKAVRIHSNWSSFLSTAETYIRGQLLCKPMDEAHLMESLQQAQVNVENALKDDFDFPRAISEMEQLVHTANKELNRRPSEQAALLAPRSTGTIAGVVAYVERIMDLFGLDLTKKKIIHGYSGMDSFYQPSSSASQHQFSNVMDTVVKFRQHVRQFALAPPEPIVPATGDAKDTRDAKKQQMKPLLQACDDIREDLKLSGIQVNDHAKESSWDVIETSASPEPSKRKT